MARAAEARLAGALSVSAFFHLTIAALAVWAFRPGPPVLLPPIYKVNIVAAPSGPRAIGEVKTEPISQPKGPTAPPKMREVAPKAPSAPAKAAKKAPSTPPTRATPSATKVARPPNAAAPRAGGGPTGGHGADVATVQTNGVDFPYPGYLNNIVRQIALNFRPGNPDAPLRADVAFLIHRDGSVSNFRFITRSGVYTFDLEAQGAVERAAKAFGPLPDGFGEDVLPVVFSFDPKFLR